MNEDASLAPEPEAPGFGETTGHSTPPRSTTVRLVVTSPEEKNQASDPATSVPQREAEQSARPAAGRQRVAGARTADPRRAAKPARKLEGTIAILGGAVLVVIALSRLLPSSFGAVPVLPPSAPAQTSATPTPLAGSAGSTSVTAAVLGDLAGLRAPQEAVELPNGNVAVADTGNKRLAILDRSGAVVASIHSVGGKGHGAGGSLQQPFAVAADSASIFLLDSQRQAIERFDLNGHFLQEMAGGVALANARGLALGPDGRLYVANPSINSLVVLSTAGSVVREITSPLGSGPDQLNQPSDIAVGRDGTVYVVDNINNRITLMKPIGTFTGEKPAPASATLVSVHVLPLPDGRLVASDPAGSLLVYPRHGLAPIRVSLRVPGQSTGTVQPLGISLMQDGKLLVTDAAGNRLLVVSIPKPAR